VLTQSQIQASTDVATLLDTAVDLLRFVTEFFEIISQSASHIHHALLLSPQSSVVRKLYGRYIHPSVSKTVTNIPTSWDSCTTSAGATIEVNHAVWSPCDQLIAIGWVDRVELRNSNTLKIVSILKPSSLPETRIPVVPKSLAFSPDGCMLACTYHG
jgi:hypothetical protein